jgi:hypothetical protein
MPTVEELLRGHVTLEVECVDRLYLNGYIPTLATAGGLIRFLREHLDKPIPSPAVLGQITSRFRDRVASPLFHLGARGAKIAPIFIARAGLDHPRLNGALDRFVQEALAKNLTLELMNHPAGRHGFDILDDDAPRERSSPGPWSS